LMQITARPLVLIEWNESTCGDGEFGQPLSLLLAAIAPNNAIRLGKPSHLGDPIEEVTTPGGRPCQLTLAAHRRFPSLFAEIPKSRSAADSPEKIESTVAASIKIRNVSGREHICGSFANQGRCSS
jgi:hypothetical protein